MKIWQSYGAEHSMDLVLIGTFKNESDAQQFYEMINLLSNFLKDNDHEFNGLTITDSEMEYLYDHKLYFLNHSMYLDQMLNEFSMELEGNKVRISSEDYLDAFILAMLHSSAKVEIFSRHDYQEDSVDA